MTASHFCSRTLCLLSLIAPCLGQSPPAPQIAVYVLEIDTNIKGEFSSVAPELTQAIQTSFSEKANAFKILERNHLDQIVKANQLERDLQAVSRGEPVSQNLTRRIRADAFIRGELVDGADGVMLTVTLVNLNSEILWQGQASESRAGWLLHETQKKDAAKMAAEAEAHLRPSVAMRNAQTGSDLSVNHKTAEQVSGSPIAATQTQSGIQPGTFVTASYRLSASRALKDGSHINLSLTVESLSDNPFRFVFLSVSCYLLDQDGNRWNQEKPDSAGFAWSGVEVDPGMKVRSSFSFVSREMATNGDYNLICSESSPQQGRRITIHGISSH